MNQKIENYHRPQDLVETFELLSRFGKKARLIAGGTDVLPQRPGIKKNPSFNHLVDISDLGLNYLKRENEHIRIGAATPINTIGGTPFFLSGPFRALSEAAEAHSTPTIKNRATVGGNLCNASLCADFPLPLLVLDAILVAAGPKGEREIPIERFFMGANFTALDTDEVLLEIRIPNCSEMAGTAFVKLRRQQTDIDMAIVNIATFLTCNKGHCEVARIALGAVGPICFRAKKAESLLTGVELSSKIIHKAALTAAKEARPIDDIRATGAYRKKMVRVLVQRSIEKSMKRCGL